MYVYMYACLFVLPEMVNKDKYVNLKSKLIYAVTTAGPDLRGGGKLGSCPGASRYRYT